MAISTQIVTDVGTTSVYLSSGDSAVTFMSLCNTTGSPIIVDVWVVPSGGSADNSNILLKNIEIIADDTYILYHGGEKILLANGDQIVATSDTASSAAAIVSYAAI